MITKYLSLFLIIFLFSSCSTGVRNNRGCVDSVSVPGLFQGEGIELGIPQGPLASLMWTPEFDAYRSSSTDQRGGNGDGRPIQPGESLTIAQLEGPGIVTHIWCTVSGEPRYSRKLVLRAWWDDAEQPSIEAPLGDFFCVGHGIDRSVNSLPIRVSNLGRARNSYWPMPFKHSARIEVENQGTLPVSSFYYRVNYIRMEQFPKTMLYFHARYRQEWPCPTVDTNGVNPDGSQNYVILETKGRGYYAGCSLSIVNNAKGWWGEGDDYIWIDEPESPPRMTGTGTEDYFGDAWGIRETEGLYCGCPVFTGLEPGDIVSLYRFHIADPVPFHQWIKATIEHGNANDRSDNWSSVAFWYQDKPFQNEIGLFAVPPVEKRLPNTDERAQTAYPSTAKTVIQNMQDGDLNGAIDPALAYVSAFPEAKCTALFCLLLGDLFDREETYRYSDSLYYYDLTNKCWGGTDAACVGSAELWRRADKNRARISASGHGSYTLYLNEEKLLSDDQPYSVQTECVELQPGKNVIAIEATNTTTPAAVAVTLRTLNLELFTDGTWLASRSVSPEWTQTGYDDQAWQPTSVQAEGFDAPFCGESILGLPGIDYRAKWIWLHEEFPKGEKVYFRKVFINPGIGE
ncbi:MAG: glycoside hydrolase family 172 protein [bacterium]